MSNLSWNPAGKAGSNEDEARRAPAPPDEAVADETVADETGAVADDRPGGGIPTEPGASYLAGDGTRPSRRAMLALCAVLFVLAAGLAAFGADRATALSAERDRRESIEETSGRFAAALLTYDYKDLEKSRTAVRSMSTEKFKKEYQRAFGSLEVLLTQTEARSQGTVTEVYLGEVDDDTATVIVVADAISHTKSGTRRTLASYIQLDLVKVSSSWLVNGVTNLNFGQGAGASTTTTTAKPAKR